MRLKTWLVVTAAATATAAAACGGSSSGGAGDGGAEGDATAEASPDAQPGAGDAPYDATSRDALPGDATQGGDAPGDGGASEAGDEGPARDASSQDGEDLDAPMKDEGTKDAQPKDAAPEAGDGGVFMMAPHPPLPPTIYGEFPGKKGVLTAPAVVSVTFPGDPFAADFAALGQGITSSKWWNETRAGFCDDVQDAGGCVVDGPPGFDVALTTAPAASYTTPEFESWLEGEITSGALPPPAVGALSQTIYVVYFPESTKIDNGGTSCRDFYGFHGFIDYGSPAQKVMYAIVDECGAVGTPKTLAETAETASHEIMEATTDPVSGYYLDLEDPNTWAWNDVLGGEVGDLCDWFATSPPYYWPGENVAYPGGLTVQRIWSNPAVSGGGDPCLPIPDGVVFFEVAPQQQVFVLDVGGQVTFDAYAYSTAPTPDWTVEAVDFTSRTTQYLSFSIAGQADGGAPSVQVNNGDVLKVTVTLLADPGKTPDGEADGTFVSSLGSGKGLEAAYEWPFIVLTPADAQKDGIDAAVSMRPRHRPHRGGRVGRGFRGLPLTPLPFAR